MLILLSQIAKEKQTGPVRCPGCHSGGGYVKYGFYERYLFGSAEGIKIQRYRCKNPQCDTVTFSILPHPYLRYVRFPLCFLSALLAAHEIDRPSISFWARSLKLSRQVVRRALERAREMRHWLYEISSEGVPWGRPCLAVYKRWTDFTRVFSWAFYPGRYRPLKIHTI
jgi:transposase-like protein